MYSKKQRHQADIFLKRDKRKIKDTIHWEGSLQV